MSDTRRKNGEEGASALPYPLPGGASGIGWSRSRHATLEEINRAMGRIQDPNDPLQPTAEVLAELLRDVSRVYDGEPVPPVMEAGQLLGLIYPMFAETASFEQRLALIDEAFKRGFEDELWPRSLSMMATLEREPVLIATGAALYAGYVLAYRVGWFTRDEIGYMLGEAELQSELCHAATFMGLAAVGTPDFLDDLAPLRQELTDDEVAVICSIPLVNPRPATVVFFLDWMDEVQRRNDQGRFAQLASAVASWGAATGAATGTFGRCIDSADLRLRVCYDPQLQITREQLGRQIQPRLEALAKSETGSRLIPPVLAAWGVGQKVEAA
ncbi:MAG TPA: hypothetical protein VLT81_15515 [Chondromyces sp.]|nr:hypothetical protein [Chondromyces sp.]